MTVEERILVMDTSVALEDGVRAATAFRSEDPNKHNTVVLILPAIAEVDKFKKSKDETLRDNAFGFVSSINQLQNNYPCTYEDSVMRVKIADNYELILDAKPITLDKNVADIGLSEVDRMLLQTCLNYSRTGKYSSVKLLSKDTGLRVCARGLNIKAEDWEGARSAKSEDAINPGWYKIDADEELRQRFLSKNSVPLDMLIGRPCQIPSVKFANVFRTVEMTPEMVYPNHYFYFAHESLPEPETPPEELRKDLKKFAASKEYATFSQALNKMMLARYDSKTGEVKKLFTYNKPEGIVTCVPLNFPHKFALNAMECEDITILTLPGPAGSGKTLLAIACGLKNTLEKKYERLVIARPMVHDGPDIGFLPGKVNQKYSPWVAPFADNLEFVAGITLEELQKKELLELQPLQHIQGRSYHNAFIILDEAQNIKREALKRVATRSASGTTIVICGDPYQIEDKQIDLLNCGIVAASNRLACADMTATVLLPYTVRSRAADAVARLL